KGSLYGIHNLFSNTIKNYLHLYNIMQEMNISPTTAFIHRCLTIDPCVQPTVLELLADEW
ncbi:hypothetical protein BDR04DRAFT_971028, partial [Suillus decipiens]